MVKLYVEFCDVSDCTGLQNFKKVDDGYICSLPVMKDKEIDLSSLAFNLRELKRCLEIRNLTVDLCIPSDYSSSEMSMLVRNLFKIILHDFIGNELTA